MTETHQGSTTMSLFNYPELTAHHLANLDRLASYLEQLPEDYRQFDMAHYFVSGQDDPSPYGSERRYADTGELPHYCGTVACALGHGPAAGVGLTRDCYLAEGAVCWSEYGTEFTPSEGVDGTLLWRWLFGGLWADFDNTHRGAAARIRFVLADQRLPEDWGDYDTTYHSYRRAVATYAPYRVETHDHVKEEA